MGLTSTIVISHDYLDWIKRNPAVFVNGLIGRMEQGECDPRPGFARWHGDAMPGVQLVNCSDNNDAAVIITNGGSGKKVATAKKCISDVDALKAMAAGLGYSTYKTLSTGGQRPIAVPKRPIKKQKQAASKKNKR